MTIKPGDLVIAEADWSLWATPHLRANLGEGDGDNDTVEVTRTALALVLAGPVKMTPADQRRWSGKPDSETCPTWWCVLLESNRIGWMLSPALKSLPVDGRTDV